MHIHSQLMYGLESREQVRQSKKLQCLIIAMGTSTMKGSNATLSLLSRQIRCYLAVLLSLLHEEDVACMLCAESVNLLMSQISEQLSRLCLSTSNACLLLNACVF